MSEKDKTQTQIVIPVVFLGLYCQPQYVLVDVPGKQQQVVQEEVEAISEEDLLLLQKLGLREIQTSQQEAFTIPAFLPQETINQLSLALEIKDDHERFRVCYAILQTYPQLLHSLNEYLPKQYHFPDDDLCDEVLLIDVPILKSLDNREQDNKFQVEIFQKQLQNHPRYLRNSPDTILQDNIRTFRMEQSFENHQQLENFGKLCNYRPIGPCELKVSGQRRIPASNTHLFSCGPQYSEKPLNNISCLYDCEIPQLTVEGRSTFMDETKNEASGKFLLLLKDQYKSLHLNKFKDLMKEFDSKRINIEQLQLATTMLYFDKLDVMYYFYNMQRLSQNDNKQPKLGWPTTCPVKKPDQTIMNIIKSVDECYNELNKRGMRNQMITELYSSIFQLARRTYEHNYSKLPQNIKIDYQSVRNYTEKNNKMVEFRIEDATGFNMIVKMPKNIYDNGINSNENSEEHSKFYDMIFNQIRQQKISSRRGGRSRQQDQIGEKTDAEDLEETTQLEVHKKWKRTSVKLPTIKQKYVGKSLILSLIKAGKLNAVTIFDLDHFFDLCLRVCNLDVDYPGFQYDEYMRRTSFGDQIGLIKPSRNLFLVLLRFWFGSQQFLKNQKGSTQIIPPIKEIIDMCRYAAVFIQKNLVSPHALLGDSVTPISLEEQEEIEVAQDDSDDTRFNLKMLMGVIEGTVSYNEFIKEIVDKQDYFQIKAKDITQFSCSSNCNCNKQLIKLCIDSENKDHQELPKEILVCGKLFDSVKRNLHPGYVLLSSNDVFADDLDDQQSFTYISTLNQYKFEKQEEIDECFYIFQNYSMFHSFKRINYCCQYLLASELFYQSSLKMQQVFHNLLFDDLFSAFYSCRLDAVLSGKDNLSYWQKFQTLNEMYDKANIAPPQPQLKHLERLQKSYDRNGTIAELFKTSMIDLDFKIVAANCYCDNPLCSLFSPKNISVSYNSIVHHQLRSPEDMNDMIKEQIVEKEGFVFPPTGEYESPDYEPETDISILKKDIHINKLVAKGYSYKITPDEMYELQKKQHPQNYEIGIYDYDPYHKPENFFEVRELANSVLNRGKYFTIPFGSEANRPAETTDNDEQDNYFAQDLAGLMDKHQQQQSQSAVKSQYYKYMAPTGAEARVCHIEEEQLCFGLFRIRSMQLMKILIEWMAIYTPAILKFFDCSITTTTIIANPDLKSHYQYRQNIDQHLSNKYDQKQNTYFYQNEYREYCDMDVEKSADEEDDELVLNSSFSLEFDRALADIYTIYVHYNKLAQSDGVLNKAQVNQLTDDWAKNGCYAPLQPWPFGNQSAFSLPPPPYIPLVLQMFLTQIYSTGDILDEMYKNPILSIPVIARTMQHQIAASQHAEQRAAIAWRLLYPESYYRSIDHYWVCLQSYDKKYLQQKPLQNDMVRRITDYETGNNPNLLDSCIDPCLPKIFDTCYFPVYALQLGINLNDPAFLLSYNLRLSRQSYFTPQSIFRTEFKFSSSDQLIEMLRVGAAFGVPQQTQMLSMVMSKSLFTTALKDQSNFYNELNHSQIINIFGKGDMAAKLYELYPSINLSLFYTSDEYKKILLDCHSRFEWEKQRSIFKSIFDKQQNSESIDPRQMIFMEDLVMDIRNTDQLAPVNKSDINLYDDPQISKYVFDSLKSLSYDNIDVQKMLKTEFEKCIEQNLFMPSLFQTNGQPKCMDEIYSKYRHMTMPNPTPRSVVMLRNCIFNERMTDDEVLSICTGQLSQIQMMEYFDVLDERIKKDQLNKIFSVSQQNQKQNASLIIPNLQNELIKRMVFDKFFVPLLFASNDKVCVRYMDQELYILLRFIHIACTRLEYSILVVEKLPSTVRQVAVHGTRSCMPFPYSDLNLNNMGCSLFGYNIIEYQEQQQQKALTKTFVDGISAQVSQRVFHGHQPYVNLTNISDNSICGCKCGYLSCSFCGCVGSGLNGTLSGNINHRAAINQSVDLTYQLCNGIFKYKSCNKCVDNYSWEDIVFMQTWTHPDRNIVDVYPFFKIENQISLLYQLSPVIPHYCSESQVFDQDSIDLSERSTMRTATSISAVKRPGRQKRDQSMRSTEVSETDNDEPIFDLNAKMQEVRNLFKQQENPSYFVSNYGQRLCDVMMMLPPPDQHTQNFYITNKNMFVQEYISSFSHYQTIISRANLKLENQPYDILTLLDYNQPVPLYQVDDYVQPLLLNSDFVKAQLAKYGFENGIDGFQQRFFITRPRYDFNRELKDLYYVLMQMQPNNKDDDLNTEIYSVLGTYSHPFLSLRKLMQNVYKRIESLFKSNKCTPQNGLTSAFLAFGIWQSMHDIPILPIHFHSSVAQMIDELNEDVYFVEAYNNFITLQCFVVETPNKSGK